MRYGPVSAAQRRRASNRFSQIVLGVADRVEQVGAARQSRGDGGREGAARAMRVRRVDAWGGERVKGMAVEEHVDGVTFAMAAFDNHGARTEIEDVTRCLADLVVSYEPPTDQHFGFAPDRLWALLERHFAGLSAYDCLHGPLR